jgi:Family of unknown function (DUF6535)
MDEKDMEARYSDTPSAKGVERNFDLFGNPQSSNYDDPSSKIWSVYNSEASVHDKGLLEGWKSDMDGILIFVRTSSHRSKSASHTAYLQSQIAMVGGFIFCKRNSFHYRELPESDTRFW